MLSEPKEQVELLGESFGKGVIDSGCGKTVCGQTWLDDYISSLNRSDAFSITTSKVSCNFRFGDGEVFSSNTMYTIPIQVGSVEATLDTHVVQSEIPLLLSRESLKRAGAEIDFKSDKICMLGQKIPITTSQSGHLLLPLTGIAEDCLLTSPINPKDMDTSRKQIEKLHKQFAHPRSEKLKQLIKTSGVSDKGIDKIVDIVSEGCDICKRFKKPHPRPIVAMPLATDFNETVAMDIKFIQGYPILHIIDHVTRYSAAARVNSKKPEAVIQCVLNHWIRIFGHPKSFLVDNGGEFDNEELKDMCEKFNIHIRTTAAESPWSNGLCERANEILASMVSKIMEDSNCSLDIAIPWAVSAKNALSNTYGFSPNQLVFGRNIELPNVLTDLPPAQNNNSGHLVAKHLMALHKARQAFINQESCEKLRRALNRQTRTYSDFQFQNGDLVYYKRLNRSEWHGPAKVLGRDGSQFLLKHGSRYVRVHQCKMQPVLDFETGATQDRNNDLEASQDQYRDQESSDHQTEYDHTDTESKSEEENQQDDHESLDYQEEDEHINTESVTEEENNASNVSAFENSIDTATEERTVDHQNRSTKRSSKLPMALARLADYNKPPTEDIYFGNTSNKIKFKEAKEEEVKRWRDNDVFLEIKDEGQPRITTRWVCTEKNKGNKTQLKARLVARGFEEDTSQLRSDSPTCSKESLRLLISIVSSKRWELKSMDIKGAYLQGLPISRELYLQPPTGFSEGKVWKLKKTPYGLVDAGRKWYIKVLKELGKTNGDPSKHDKALFIWRKDNNLTGMLVAHVDDFLYGGDETFNKQTISQIKLAFDVGNEEERSFKYTGLEVNRDKLGNILLDTEEYCKSINEVDTNSLGPRSRPLSPSEITILKSKAGQINWIAGQSRPDLAFDNCALSNRTAKPTVDDLHFANKVIRRIGSKEIKLIFPQQLEIDKVQVVAFCDASHANLPDKGSQGGLVVFLLDNKGYYCTVTWQSRRIKRIVNSTIAAECLVAVETAERCLLLSTIMKEITGKEIKTSIFSDNKSLIDAAHSTTQMENKRLQIDMGILREMLEKGELDELRWIDTKYQVANPLTKAGAPADYLMSIITGRGLKFNFNTGIFA